MAKGFFTQGVAVLLTEPPTLDRIAAALEGRVLAGSMPGDATPGWTGHHPSVLLDVDPALDGKIVVDVVGARWPDHLGDPQKEPELFAAWNMGLLGPFTFPGGLERAAACCFRWGEAEGRAAVTRHQAFLRVRSTYFMGAALSPGTRLPPLPADYDAEADLEAVTKVAADLLALPQALAYFNPGGEVLVAERHVRDSLAMGLEHTLPPLELWANARVFADGDWAIMDTVGMNQLDMDDHEVCFRRGDFDLQAMHAFLRNATFHVLERGPVIKDGDAVVGPGGVGWQARAAAEGLSAPPRATVRWFPVGGPPPPERLLPGGVASAAAAQPAGR